MSIADEPDDTPGASTGGKPGAGGGATPADPDPAPAPVTHPDRYSWVPYIVGFGVLLTYGFFLNKLLGLVKGTPELDWARYIYLFTGVEALAFGAAGFFFGREVNRGRAQEAETRAKVQANRAANAEKKEADANAKGQVLAVTLNQVVDGAEAPAAAVRAAAPERITAPPAIPAEQLRGLATLANQWFPRR